VSGSALKPLKRFGQHFLTDHKLARQIVELARITPDEPVWEIGPGTGILTSLILKHTAHLSVFEIDKRLIGQLQTQFGNHLRIYPQDIISVDWLALLKQEMQTSGRQVVLLSNLPYQITSPVLELLELHADFFSRCVLMIQKEVADRLCARPGSRAYGLLTLKLGGRFDISQELCVPPSAFEPPPKVHSAVIRLLPRQNPLYVKSLDIYHQLIERAFTHKRKTLRNNLKPYYPAELLQYLEHISGVDLNLRGEAVEEAGFIRMADCLHDAGSAGGSPAE